MKTIFLMRHAKAEHGVPGQRDFDRALAPRGGDDALRMGRVLEKLEARPDAIVASPAARARETAEAAAKAVRFAGKIRWERRLYDAPGHVWIDVLREVEEPADSALVVAHNPGVSEAASLLCGAPPGAFDVPTGGLIAMVADVGRWRDLGDGAAAVRWFLRPGLVESL